MGKTFKKNNDYSRKWEDRKQNKKKAKKEKQNNED